MKRALQVGLSLAVTIALLFALSRETTWAELKDLVLGLDRRFLLIFLSLSLLGLFVRAYRYYYLLARVSNTEFSFKNSLILTSIRNALVDSLPARLGELSYFYICGSLGVSVPHSAAVFALCFALDIAVLLAILGGIMILGFLGFSPLAGVLIFFGAALATLAVWKVDLILSAISNFLLSFKGSEPPDGEQKQAKSWLNRFGKLVEKTAEAYEKLSDKRVFLGAYAQTVVLRVLKYSSLYFLMISLTASLGLGMAEISPIDTSLGFISAEAAASLPFSGFMGFGAYEGTFSIINKAVGGLIPKDLAVIFVVHLITQVVGYFIGAIAAVAFAFSNRA